MTLPNFGLPEQQQAYSLLNREGQANANDLAQFTQAVGGQLLSAIADNQANLQAIISPLRRSNAGIIAANTRSLNDVVRPLGSQLLGDIASGGIVLSQLQPFGGSTGGQTGAPMQPQTQGLSITPGISPVTGGIQPGGIINPATIPGSGQPGLTQFGVQPSTLSGAGSSGPCTPVTPVVAVQLGLTGNPPGPDYTTLWLSYNPCQFCIGSITRPPGNTDPSMPGQVWFGQGYVPDNDHAAVVTAWMLSHGYQQIQCDQTKTPGPPGYYPPGYTPPAPPPGTPPPTYAPSPGSSCTSPLYIQICQPQQPTTTPPYTQPQPQQCPPGYTYDPNSGQCVITGNQPPQPPGGADFGICVSDTLPSLTAYVNSALQNNPQGFLQQIKTIVGGFPFGIGPLLSTAIDVVASSNQNIVNAMSCNAPIAVGISYLRATVAFLDHWGVRLPEVVKVLDYGVNYACPTELPSVAEAHDAWLWAGVDDSTWEYWIRCNGFCPTPQSSVLYARREKPTAEQIIQFGRRVDMQDEQIAQVLTYYGFIDQGEAAIQVILYDELPTVQDQLHFLQRNVYDTAYVEDYDLLEGFEERFWNVAGPSLRAIGVTPEVAALHYAAHWINPAPEQLKSFVYRLREDKPGVENPFTPEDYERLLVEQDVSPFMRSRFRETLYQVPALGYVRDMYRSYILSDDELKSIHQDLGYDETNSQRFLDIDRLLRARMRANETHGWNPQAMAHAYISNVWTKEEVIAGMDALGYTEIEANNLMARARADLQYTVIQRARSRVTFQALSTIKSAIESGVMSAQDGAQQLQSLGWPEQFATSWAQIQATGAQIKLVKQATSRIRSEYLSGAIDIQQAGQALSVLGIDPSAAEVFLSTWQVEFTPKRKRRSAGQIVNDVANDEMTTGEAYVRLRNLGYPDADSRLFLADASRKILDREQKLEALQGRADRQAAAELARTLASAERQQRQLLDALKRISSPSKLQKWAKLGIIGRDLFFERMRTFAYDDTDIERWYEEACASKGASCRETTPPTPSPPAGATGTGFPG